MCAAADIQTQTVTSRCTQRREARHSRTAAHSTGLSTSQLFHKYFVTKRRFVNNNFQKIFIKLLHSQSSKISSNRVLSKK